MESGLGALQGASEMAIKWTPELLDRIVTGLESYSLRRLCSINDDLPSRDSITDYMRDHAEFSARCASARASHAEMMDDRILDVAEKVMEGELDPHAGKVAISAFQWRASKLDPKKYGDRVQQDVNVSGELQLAERLSMARKRK
jgi:hypothetical protein